MISPTERNRYWPNYGGRTCRVLLSVMVWACVVPDGASAESGSHTRGEILDVVGSHADLLYLHVAESETRTLLVAVDLENVVTATTALLTAPLTISVSDRGVVGIEGLNNTITAYGAKSLVPLWTFSTDGHLSLGKAGRFVVAACRDHKVFSIGATRGEPLWERRIACREGVAPTVTDDAIWIPTNKALLGLDHETGRTLAIRRGQFDVLTAVDAYVYGVESAHKKVLAHSLAGQSGLSLSIPKGSDVTLLAACDGLAILSTAKIEAGNDSTRLTSRVLHGMSATDGRAQWSRRLPDLSGVTSSVGIASGGTIAVLNGNGIHGLACDTGRERWKSSIAHKPGRGIRMWVGGSRIYYSVGPYWSRLYRAHPGGKATLVARGLEMVKPTGR